jgi:4-amino-4-deoxy-L-arabinose transferase-like glycosyltransferase
MMNFMKKYFDECGFILLLPFVFLICDVIRPPLPVDETRYLTVAWEIWLSQDWIHLTYNFEPYHHKPPLLFWLINIFWSFMGTTQLAASLPGILSAVVTVLLSGRLAEKLFPQDTSIARKTMLLVMGCLPFLIYAPMIRFDIMIAMWCVASWLMILSLAERRRFLYLVILGLCMGMGVLTKGPVIYIYTLVPALLAPLWMPAHQKHQMMKWYAGVFAAVLISAIPVAFWLVPINLEADSYFLYWLLWKQSAGRITGSFDNAHIRPFYFYIPYIS